MNYKEKFLQIARGNIKREGLEDLLKSLEQTDFFTSPASAKFHGAIDTGLVQHSIKVYEYLLSSAPLVYGMDINLESITIVSLFHDLCKIGNYKVSSRNVKDENNKWIQVPYYDYSDDVFPVGHGEKSILMILEHLKLTFDEMLAIRWHMGGFAPKEEYYTLGTAYSKSKLALYLHFADMQATYIDNL